MNKINKTSNPIEKTKTTHRKIVKGVIVSDKTKNMVVVAVDQTKINKKYKKRYKFTKKYHAHSMGSNYKNGDVVVIE
ncbi:MAG TPA: 30S ribosomal protein S17, partial [Candidatus Portnoybacteria bacterium]|nr:30S ribosomal protein S17 [Candidatus Portnoybacteria bacterium]